MVVSLGPGKFYGSSLPRPRFYTDVKFNTERVDPPVAVLDPLLSWANEAHWSMGGLSFNRLRLQGRIEGNVERLRVQREKEVKEHEKFSISPKVESGKGVSGKKRGAASPTPPPAPIASKRRRYMALIEDDDESEEEEELEKKVVVEEDDDEDEEDGEEEDEPVRVVNKRKPARKLYEEFNRVADKRKPDVSSGSPKGGLKRKSDSGNGIRTSPRLARAAQTASSPKTRASRRLVKRA